MITWEKYDNGIELLDAKTVTLKDGTTGSILVDSNNVCIYKVDVDSLANTLDLGEVFLDNVEKNKPNAFIKDEDLLEAFERLVIQKEK